MPFSTFIQFYVILLILFLMVYVATIRIFGRGLFHLKCQQDNYWQPSISIIICMHNEASNAAPCIEKLIKLIYPKNLLEIILVDDRSTDKTPQILSVYAHKYSFIKMISVKETPADFAPKKYAINQAIHEARGEFILLTDADGRVPDEWVNHMLACFSDEVGMVIGYAPYNTLPPFDHFFYRLLALEYLSHASVAAASTGLSYPLTCVGTNMAYRREVYLELNGFGKFKHVLSGDDDLFLQRVREETNWHITYCTHPNSQIINDPPSNWKSFFHQRVRYTSKGFFYPLKVTIALVLFYAFNLLLLFTPLMVLLNPLVIIPLILILSIKGISEYMFLKTAAKSLNDIRHIHLFPVAFLLHIPYVVVFGLMGRFKKFKWGDLKS